MNFQGTSRTVFGMAKQQTISDLEQKKIKVRFKEMEKIN